MPKVNLILSFPGMLDNCDVMVVMVRPDREACFGCLPAPWLLCLVQSSRHEADARSFMQP